MVNLFLFVLLGVVFLGGAIVVIDAVRLGIGPMPTSIRIREELLRQIPTELNGPIYELGSGWGTLAFRLARQHPHTQVIAVEAAWIPWLFCRIRQFSVSLKNLRIIRSDFFDMSLHDADVIVCYLYPDAMVRLREKFDRELPVGTIVISHTFAIPGWIPESLVTCDDLYHSPIYYYKI